MADSRFGLGIKVAHVGSVQVKAQGRAYRIIQGAVGANVADPSPGADPLRELARRQIDDRIRAAMAGLSEQERSAFVMRHFEGLSIDEIGRTLDLKASAAKHSVFRAVQKLRRSLEPLGETRS